MNDHESGFVDAFVPAPKRERLREALPNPKKRKKALDRLAHNPDLDFGFAQAIPGPSQNPSGIEKMLRAKGAAEQCYVISESVDFDGRTIPLREALDSIVGQGMGTIISCVPGRLCYYEGEDPKSRYIFAR